MFVLNDDLSIYATRGDIVFFSVSAQEDGVPYKFQAGDVVRIKVFGKKDAESVVLQKDFPITEETEQVEIFLSEEDTKVGDVISKPKDYWYEVELNPHDNPQTIIGYDEDGAKVFKLFPEGDDIPEFVPDPEDFKVMDDELDMTSDRPVQNQAIARAVVSLRADFDKTNALSNETAKALSVERERLDNLVANDDVANLSQNLEYLDFITENTKAKIDAHINSDGVFATIKVNLREANLVYGGTTMDVFIVPNEGRPIDTGVVHTADGLEYSINYDTTNNRYVLNLRAQDDVTVAPSGAGSVTFGYPLGDYELKDLRVGADGKIYPTAGEAVRAQFETMRAASEVVTPQMYGAVGDGKADDTEAIQAALDRFIGTAGEVFVPHGQYLITAPLTIKSNVRLSGASSAKYGRYNSDIPSAVIFYGGEDAIESVIKYDRDGSTVFGGGISNLTIDGRKKADYAVNLCKSGRVVIENNSIVNSLKAGVYAENSYENIIKENWFGYNSEYAIALGTNANANTVRDNAIQLSDESSGILVSGSNGNVISGNVIEGGHGASVGINIAATVLTRKNIVTENRVEFESHRYEGQTEGICIIVGEEGKPRPHGNFVSRNAVFNQVVLTNGGTTVYNHKNEFVDYGLGTVTDFYDHTILNENAKMVVLDGALVNYKHVDDGFNFEENGSGVRIKLLDAVYQYPLVYQVVNVKHLRGEEIALSCMLKCNDRFISVGIEYYKEGRGDTWRELGTYITATRDKPYDLGTYQLVQISDIVPDDCDTAVIVLNFGADVGIPADADVDVKWCKMTRLATWR